MPPKRATRKKTHKKRKTQKGKGVMDVIRYVKDNKLLSKGLGIIPHPTAQGLSALAGMVGLGRKRRKRTTKRRVTVVGVRATKLPTAGKVRRVKAPRTTGVVMGPMGMSTMLPARRRRQNGRGIFSDLGGGIGSIFSGLGGGIGSIGHGIFG
jgi:hypothetical protein